MHTIILTEIQFPDTEVYDIVYDELKEERLIITFHQDSDGWEPHPITFLSEHEYDCCERVYADFSQFSLYKNRLVGMGIRDLEVVEIDGMGLRFDFTLRDGYYNLNIPGDDKVKVLIPCYNIQNGYYSSQLQLKIMDTPSGDFESDITDSTRDIIE